MWNFNGMNVGKVKEVRERVKKRNGRKEGRHL